MPSVACMAQQSVTSTAPAAHPGPSARQWDWWGGLELSEEGPIGQIVRTTAESQKIVAARPLYFLQHRVRAKSSARDLPQ